MSTRRAEPGEEGGKKKGKSKLLLLLVVVVALVAGVGYVKVYKKKTVVAAGTPATTTTTVAGAVMVLPALTLNLAGGHYLQVTPALQLATAEKATDMDKYRPRIVDTCIAALSGDTMAALSARGGMVGAQQALTRAIDAIYPGTVTDVYFTQFVMQ